MRRRKVRAIAEATLVDCSIDDTDRVDDDPATHHFGRWEFTLDTDMRVCCVYRGVRTDDPTIVSRFTGSPHGAPPITGKTSEEIEAATLMAAINAARWAMLHEMCEHFRFGAHRPFAPVHEQIGESQFRSGPTALRPREEWAS